MFGQKHCTSCHSSWERHFLTYCWSAGHVHSCAVTSRRSAVERCHTKRILLKGIRISLALTTRFKTSLITLVALIFLLPHATWLTQPKNNNNNNSNNNNNNNSSRKYNQYNNSYRNLCKGQEQQNRSYKIAERKPTVDWPGLASPDPGRRVAFE